MVLIWLVSVLLFRLMVYWKHTLLLKVFRINRGWVFAVDIKMGYLHVTILVAVLPNPRLCFVAATKTSKRTFALRTQKWFYLIIFYINIHVQTVLKHIIRQIRRLQLLKPWKRSHIWFKIMRTYIMYLHGTRVAWCWKISDHLQLCQSNKMY